MPYASAFLFLIAQIAIILALFRFISMRTAPAYCHQEARLGKNPLKENWLFAAMTLLFVFSNLIYLNALFFSLPLSLGLLVYLITTLMSALVRELGQGSERRPVGLLNFNETIERDLSESKMAHFFIGMVFLLVAERGELLDQFHLRSPYLVFFLSIFFLAALYLIKSATAVFFLLEQQRDSDRNPWKRWIILLELCFSFNYIIWLIGHAAFDTDGFVVLFGSGLVLFFILLLYSRLSSFYFSGITYLLKGVERVSHLAASAVIALYLIGTWILDLYANT